MTTMDEIIEGFTILRRYDEKSADEVNTDRDVLWAGPEDFDAEQYSLADTCRLERLGWHFDEDINRWANYT